MKHILYGDNIHDDTKALQALADGEDVYWSDGKQVKHDLRNQIYLVSKPIRIKDTSSPPFDHAVLWLKDR